MGLTRRLSQPLLAVSFIAGGVETLLDPGPRIASRGSSPPRTARPAPDSGCG